MPIAAYILKVRFTLCGMDFFCFKLIEINIKRLSLIAVGNKKVKI